MEIQEVIDAIVTIVRRWGPFNTAEVCAETSPIYNSFGNTCSLIERFNISDVDVVTYSHDREVDEFSVAYEELNEDQLYEIQCLADEYDADMDKTMRRCED